MGPNLEDLGAAAGNVVDGDAAVVGTPKIGKALLSEVKAEGSIAEMTEGPDANEAALQFADVGRHCAGDE